MPTTTTRDELDGTVPGVAVLVMASLTDPDTKVLHERIQERVTYSEHVVVNPHEAAERLWEATKADWPGYGHAVIVNERARYLMTKARMESILGNEFTIDAYLATT